MMDRALGGLLVGIVIGIVMAWLYFVVWRLRYSAAIRENAVQRSLAVTAGKVHEQLVTYLPEFGFNPKDARFLGSPVDLIVFDGLAAGHVPRGEPVEHDEIDRTAQKARILRIEAELGEVRHELLVNFPGGDGETALHRILANRCAVAQPPDHEVEPRHHDPNHDADEKASERSVHHASL